MILLWWRFISICVLAAAYLNTSVLIKRKEDVDLTFFLGAHLALWLCVLWFMIPRIWF